MVTRLNIAPQGARPDGHGRRAEQRPLLQAQPGEGAPEDQVHQRHGQPKGNQHRVQWSPVIRAMLNSSALLIVQNWLKDFGRNGPVDPADGPFGQSLVC